MYTNLFTKGSLQDSFTDNSVDLTFHTGQYLAHISWCELGAQQIIRSLITFSAAWMLMSISNVKYLCKSVLSAAL